MSNIDDEERKKRLEKAKSLRNSVGMITANDETSISEETNSNNTEQTVNDYQEKLNRAKQLRNSVGMITSKDLDNEIDINKDDEIEEIEEIQDDKTEEIQSEEVLTKNNLEENNTEQAIVNNNEIYSNNVENITDSEQNNEEKVPNYRNNNTSSVQTPNQTIKKANEGLTTVSTLDMQAMEEAEERNDEIEKGGYHTVNATLTTILKNIEGGAKTSVAGLVDAVTTVLALGVRGMESWANIFNNNEASNKLNTIYNDLVDEGSDIKERAEYESNVTARIENNEIRTAGQVTNTITEMLTNKAIAMALGVDGTLIQGITVGGRSAQEVLDENKDNIGKATVTGVAKGYTSYLTEKMFDANILTKGTGGSISDKVDELIFDTIKSKFGKEFANKIVGVIGENLEELIEDNVDNVIDKLINDKDFPEWQEWLNNTTETFKVTSISTIIMDLLGLGGANFESKEPDIINRKMERKIQKIIDDGGLAIKYNDTINQSDIGQFYTTTFNQDGTLKDIEATSGKQIVNVNTKLNIKPVIIKKANTNIYNVIDGNTGLLLDNSPYTSTLSAEQWFDHKIINLDEASIKGINNKVAKSNMALQDKIMEVASEAEQQLNNMSQESTKQPQNSNMNSEATNYIGSVENGQNIENNKTLNNENKNNKKSVYEKEIETYKNKSAIQNKISDGILNINTNIFDGISKKKQSNILNEYLKNEVKGKDYYVDGQKIIANSTTIGKLKNGKTNFDKRIDANIRNELKANIITNLDNVIKSSRLYQADRLDTKDHSFADTFDRRKSIITYKGNNYEVMFEIGKKGGRNTLYSIENIKKINHITSGISSKKTSKTPIKGGRSNVTNESISQNNDYVNSNKKIDQVPQHKSKEDLKNTQKGMRVY